VLGSLRDPVLIREIIAAAKRFWSPQLHSAQWRTLSQAVTVLFNLIKSIPPTLRYEPGVIVAEGDFVIIHGRFLGASGCRPTGLRRDILRIEDGILVEHWDVIQDEATKEQSKKAETRCLEIRSPNRV